jgi:hypothetical protein
MSRPSTRRDELPISCEPAHPTFRHRRARYRLKMCNSGFLQRADRDRFVEIVTRLVHAALGKQQSGRAMQRGFAAGFRTNQPMRG